MLAQCDTDGAGQRRHVDNALRTFALGVRDAVDKNEPALGVGVDDLDGLTRDDW